VTLLRRCLGRNGNLGVNVPCSSNMGLRSWPLLHMRVHAAVASLRGVSEAAAFTPRAVTLEVVPTKLCAWLARLRHRLVGECGEQHCADRWQLGATMLDDRLEPFDERKRNSRFGSVALFTPLLGRATVKAISWLHGGAYRS
jgi:hypothetical protein